MPLDQRLVRLLSSVIDRTGDYTLARLELGTRAPRCVLPPPLPRLPDASEEALRARWPEIEASLEGVAAFVRRTERDDAERADPSFERLRRIFRELDQYARALRWVLTVTERTDDEPE